MRQYTKCRRNSENSDSDHSCEYSFAERKGDAHAAIDEYISAQPENVRPILKKIRKTIHAAAPKAVERISWRMPTFWQSENLIHFAAFKRHIGIYPGDLSLVPFEKRLEGYHRTKGAIQFPLDKPIDYELITDITKWRLSCVDEKEKKKNAAKLKADKTKLNKNKKNTETKSTDRTANKKVYKYEAVIHSTASGGGAYVAFPYDIRSEFGKGRVKVSATFDGEPYEGSVVNMGVKNPDGSVCYIVGILKEIRVKIGKQPGDKVKVTISERH